MGPGATSWSVRRKNTVSNDSFLQPSLKELTRISWADMQLIKDLSRVIEQSTGRNEGKADAWHYTKSSTIKITGRHVLPIWRVIKGDVALLQYSFENIVFHVLHMRCA